MTTRASLALLHKKIIYILFSSFLLKKYFTCFFVTKNINIQLFNQWISFLYINHFTAIHGFEQCECFLSPFWAKLLLSFFWPCPCSRSQIKYQQTHAINQDKVEVKSLTALGCRYAFIQFIDGKGDAFVSLFFIIGNYLSSNLVNSWKREQLVSVLLIETPLQ